MATAAGREHVTSPGFAGHRRGTKNLRPILEASVQFGIRIVTVYAFSTENWNRPQPEVDAILTILGEAIKQETPELHANGRTNSASRLAGGGAHTPRCTVSKRPLALTCHNQRLILNVAFNYGGRAEIVRALRGIIRAGLPGRIRHGRHRQPVSLHGGTAGPRSDYSARR